MTWNKGSRVGIMLAWIIGTLAGFALGEWIAFKVIMIKRYGLAKGSLIATLPYVRSPKTLTLGEAFADLSYAQRVEVFKEVCKKRGLEFEGDD